METAMNEKANTMDNMKLIDVTAENWERICCLSPGKEGRKFVASNSFSIAQSVFEKGWVIQGIQLDTNLIGFTMFGFSCELNAYELCRFMVDERYQGHGYGKRALKIIVDEMICRYQCDKIYLSTSPNNARGKHIYAGAGFAPTGETCGEGNDIDDIEEVFCLNYFG